MLGQVFLVSRGVFMFGGRDCMASVYGLGFGD